MKKLKYLMTSAFILSVIAAVAFKPSAAASKNSGKLFDNQTVWYSTGCNTSTSCSNNDNNPACVSGQTMRPTQGSCTGTTAYQYQPI